MATSTRSWLFAPGDSERKMTKATASAADIVLLDLEDAVADEGKPRARAMIADFLTAQPEADRERVFERFTRLDEARDRDEGGSGLGLAIVQELVRRSDGDIRLRDAAGGGLSAQLVLPRARLEAGS